MKSSKLLRNISVVASAALLLGAFVAAPADAAKKKKKKPPTCPAPAFVEPQSPSESRTEVPGLEVAKVVTDAATEEEPVVIEYEHGPAFWDTVNQEPIIEDTKWFNVQVDSAAPATGIYIRQEWPIPSVSDMDLYLWDGPSGTQLEVSGAFNVFPMPTPVFPTGGMGWESISGALVSDCGGYAIESRAFTTAGESMTLKIWLGEIQG